MTRLAILTTNNRGNLDDAFQRRILVQAGFPLPETDERLRLWQRFLAQLPLHADVDLTEFARRFRVSGGDIKNAVFLAARWASLLAAEGGRRLVDRVRWVLCRSVPRISERARTGDKRPKSIFMSHI